MRETKVEEGGERERAEMYSFSLLLRLWSPGLTSQRRTCRVCSEQRRSIPWSDGISQGPAAAVWTRGRCRWHREPHPMRNALLQGRSSLEEPFMETWKNLAFFEVH